MTQDKARKIATRQRMAETGEPYSVARHAVESEHSEDEAAPDGISRDGAAPGEGGLSAQKHADRARELAEHAQERAERARERAEQAGEAAMMAHDAADMAAEAATLTRGWADEQEQEQAHLRAAQARDAAEEAQRRAHRAGQEADLAEEQADLAEEQANLAEEQANLAEEEVCEADEDGWESGGRPRHRARQVHYHQGHWGGPRPPTAAAAAGRHGRSPRARAGSMPTGDRDRVGQVLQRLEEFRERAEGMVSQVERIFNLARDQAPQPDRAPQPDQAPPSDQAPRPPEPPEHPEPGSD